MIVARRGSPLVIGCHEDGTFVGSDALALVHATRQLIYLEEGTGPYCIAIGSMFTTQTAAREAPCADELSHQCHDW